MDRNTLGKLAQGLEGVPIWGCLPGSPSHRAGIRYGDVILKVNGLRTKTMEDFMDAHRLREDGMEVTLFRAGNEITFRIAFGEPIDPKTALKQAAEGRMFGPIENKPSVLS